MKTRGYDEFKRTICRNQFGGTTMIQTLCTKHNLDVNQPNQILIIEHIDSDETYHLAPLIIVTGDASYRVSRALFAGDAMKPGLSVTFDLAGGAIAATNDFGGTVDVAEAARTLLATIERDYLESERGELRG